MANGAIPRHAVLGLIENEIERAYAKHGREPWSRHEFYGILLEEVEELWADIKRDGPSAALEAEIVQIAAMCVRYCETGRRNGSDL